MSRNSLIGIGIFVGIFVVVYISGAHFLKAGFEASAENERNHPWIACGIDSSLSSRDMESTYMSLARGAHILAVPLALVISSSVWSVLVHRAARKNSQV